jgi:segregation and condensation protein B
MEGLLFAVGEEGIDLRQIAEVIELDQETAYDIITDLMNDYRRENRGVQLIQYDDTFQLTTLPEHAEYFERLVYLPSRATLSQASLETLGIISYKQPVTRAEIEELRGVQSDSALRTLLSKGLIKDVGRKDTIGRPILYGTTKEFLEYFGLENLNQLPPLLDGLAEEQEDEITI